MNTAPAKWTGSHANVVSQEILSNRFRRYPT